jgi:hypothetical protein
VCARCACYYTSRWHPDGVCILRPWFLNIANTESINTTTVLYFKGTKRTHSHYYCTAQEQHSSRYRQIAFPPSQGSAADQTRAPDSFQDLLDPPGRAPRSAANSSLPDTFRFTSKGAVVLTSTRLTLSRTHSRTAFLVALL